MNNLADLIYISIVFLRASLYLSRQDLKINRRNNDTIAMPPKTIEATGEENESKYRSGRGTLCFIY